MDFYTREDVSDHEIVLKLKLPVDAFQKSYEQMLQSQAENTDIEGFRKGKVPASMIEEKYGEAILYQTFERIAPYYVNAAIVKEKLEPAAPPAYTDLGDLKKDQPIEFTVKITIMPVFKLGNLSKIKVEKPKTDVSDKELDDNLQAIFDNNKTTLKAKKME